MISSREDPRYRENDLHTIEAIIQQDEYNLKEISRLYPNIRVIVDVGAHIGAFTVEARKWWPVAEIIAIEPNVHAYAQLVQNLRGAVDIHPLMMAVGYTSLSGTVWENEQIPTVSLVATSGIEIPDPFKTQFPPDYRVLDYKVPVLTLEDILNLVDCSRIDLLKLDCEGAEFDIVKHLSRNLALKVKIVIGEYHASGGFEVIRPLLEETFPHLDFSAPNPQAPTHFFIGIPHGDTTS